MHFVLYNPPTRLFSRVSLHAALLPAGGLALSPLVESVNVFHSDPAPRYHLLLPQVSSPASRPPVERTCPTWPPQTPAMPAGVGTGQEDPQGKQLSGYRCHVGLRTEAQALSRAHSGCHDLCLTQASTQTLTSLTCENQSWVFEA